jgi:hypothetical protein
MFAQKGFDMHKHKKYRYGPPLSRPHRGKRFIGLFWLLGLAILFSSGRWWPGILVLVGLAIFFGSLFREERPSETPSQTPPPFTPSPRPLNLSIVPTCCQLTVPTAADPSARMKSNGQDHNPPPAPTAVRTCR